MRHQQLKCETTGERYKEMQSGNFGHVQRIGNLQTNGLQTSGTDYDEISTKRGGKAEDRLGDKPPQDESRMPKKRAEANGENDYEGSASKSNNRAIPSDPATHTSNGCGRLGMLIPSCLGLPNRTIQMLRTAMRNPPVTVSTLGELDLKWMTEYVNLRCDINFDHDLHFTPIKGPRGEEKRAQAMDYWLALEAEFRIYHHYQAGRCMACERAGPGNLGSFQPRLSTMFQNLKELLETLVPDRDHDQVAAYLDIDFVTDQVEKGVLDVGKLSRWLAELLKSHCAPMRDESAEAMAEKLEYGANNGDLATLITGLENLFGFLEAMKLDVANHQIRTFRYILIEATVEFQQGYFRKKIDDGKLNLRDAEEWYQQAYHRYVSLENPQRKDGETFYFEAFVHGFVELCGSSPECCQAIPITLHYDQTRIQQLRADVHDFIVLQLCIDVFNALLSCLQNTNIVRSNTYTTLRSRLLTIADGDESTTATGFVPWNEKSTEIAVEITRAAFVVSSFPNPPGTIPADAFETTQDLLQHIFNERYETTEAMLLAQVEEEAKRHASIFGRMSTKDISESQRVYQSARLGKSGENQQQLGKGGEKQRQQEQPQPQPHVSLLLPDIENMARMLAHMAVIHWQVWRDLVYLHDDDEEGQQRQVEEQNEHQLEEAEEQEEGEDTSSSSSSAASSSLLSLPASAEQDSAGETGELSNMHPTKRTSPHLVYEGECEAKDIGDGDSEDSLEGGVDNDTKTSIDHPGWRLGR